MYNESAQSFALLQKKRVVLLQEREGNFDVQHDTTSVLNELAQAGRLGMGDVVVIGASTSEVNGQPIGTSGAMEVAKQLFTAIKQVQQQYRFHIAIQCCEHLNRALVVERDVLRQLRLTEVCAVPVPAAGGALAALAYHAFTNGCLAEAVVAHAGVDIGETLIGMHLRPVVVPYRTQHRYIGRARVIAALTRPKLIGGQRAVYSKIDSFKSIE